MLEQIRQEIRNGEGLSAVIGQRWVNAWWDIEDQVYRLDAGFEGYPRDHTSEFESDEDLMDAMLGFAPESEWSPTRY